VGFLTLLVCRVLDGVELLLLLDEFHDLLLAQVVGALALLPGRIAVVDNGPSQALRLGLGGGDSAAVRAQVGRVLDGFGPTRSRLLRFRLLRFASLQVHQRLAFRPFTRSSSRQS